MGLKNYQYDVILRQFDARRLRSKYMLDKRTEEIYNKFPEILDIDNTIAEQSMERARLAIMGDEHALDTLASDNEALSARKRLLLVKNGYPEEYLTPHYECELCHDTGFVNGERCSCFKAALSNLIYSESNIRDIIKDQNFDNFDFSLYSDTPMLYARSGDGREIRKSPREVIDHAVSIAHSFIDDFDRPFAERANQNLFIYGEPGLGKTYLINCIAKELLDNAHTVLYYTAYRFFNYIEQCKFRPDSNELGDLSQEYLIDCDLLVIDDLGTELTNTFTNSALYTVINERQLKQHPTIISTNFGMDQLEERYSERIFSRISQNYSPVKIIGSDIRRK